MERLRRAIPLGELLRSPWQLRELLTFRHLLMALGFVVLLHIVTSYPLLLSIVIGATLLVWWRRWDARARSPQIPEATHAVA